MAREAEVVPDTDPSVRRDAVNPARPLLSAFAACMLNGLERVTPMHADDRNRRGAGMADDDAVFR
ncbi:MAG: hypothetical protein Kow0013_27010 [Pararhodobacter sp.]